MHGLFVPQAYTIMLPVPPAVLVIAVIWTLALKAFALWYAARGGQKTWFVALLLVNTLGILEIAYLLWFRPQSFELEERPENSSSLAVR